MQKIYQITFSSLVSNINQDSMFNPVPCMDSAISVGGVDSSDSPHFNTV